MAEARTGTADAALFGVVAVVWGLNYLFVRVGLTLEPPVWLAALRAGIGALGVLAWLAVRREWGRLPMRDVRDALAIGVPNTAIFFGLWFVAAAAIPPGQTAVLVYTFPLWVTLLAGPLLHERPARLQLAAVAAGFFGVVLVSQPWLGGTTALAPMPILELLGGALSWALGTVLFKRRFRGPVVPQANALQLVGGTLGLVAVGFLVEGPPPAHVGTTLLLIVLWLGLLGTALAYTIWFRLLARRPAVTLSGYTFLVPLVALAASFALFGESLDLVQAVGVAAVLAAIYGNARGSLRPPAEAGVSRRV